MIGPVPKSRLYHEAVGGKLDLDFKNIILIQKDSEVPRIFEGPGSIERLENGKIAFKIYARCSSEHSKEDFLAQANAVSGEIYDSSSYYSMSAITYNNKVYSAENVRFSRSGGISEQLLLLSGQLDKIEYLFRGAVEDTYSVALVFRNQSDVEWRALLGENWIGAPITGYRLKVSVEANSSIGVVLTSACELPANIEMRVAETLQFMLAQKLSVSWLQLSSKKGGKAVLYPHSNADARSRLMPPLDLRLSLNKNYALDLFSRYLQFSRNTKLQNYWHPCTSYVLHAVSANAGSLDASIVGLSVAIEGVASYLPVTINKIEKKKMKYIKDIVERFFKKKGFDKNITDRVPGLIGQLNNTRLKDRLQKCINDNKIPKDYFDAWGRVRHKAVHTSELTADDFSDPSLQAVLTDVQKLNTLLHMIIFVSINYNGQYSDYGAKDWPQKNF